MDRPPAQSTPEQLPLAQPVIGEREERLLLETLRTGRLSLGPLLERFERTFAAYVGAPCASAVSSGTAGLHLALRAVGVEEGDEVITSPFSFVASANVAVYERARPVFAAIDPVTLNLDPRTAAAAVTERTAALLPVHIFGYPADIPAFERLGLPSVEDACEALGAIDARGAPVGSRGHPAVFGFYPNKQLTPGEGGMVTTAKHGFKERIDSERNQGRAPDMGWLDHDRLGFNYRLAELACALGLAPQGGLWTDEVAFLSPRLGSAGAGIALSVTTFCALAGRVLLGAVVDRLDARLASGANFLLEVPLPRRVAALAIGERWLDLGGDPVEQRSGLLSAQTRADRLAAAGEQQIPWLASITLDRAIEEVSAAASRSLDSAFSRHDASNGFERIDYEVNRGQRAIQSVLRLAPEEHRTGLVNSLRPPCERLQAFGNLQKERLRSAGIQPQLPASGPQHSEAAHIIVKRKRPGVIPLDDLPQDQWDGYPSGAWATVPTLALYWCDGKRNLAEVIRLTNLESGPTSFDFVGYFRFLERHGYVEFVK